MPCGGGDAIPLPSNRVTVGRAADCDVTIPSGTVSSRHCLLELRDGGWTVTDLGSHNGIRIDGVRRQEGSLAPGSILSIAQLRFLVDYEPARPEATAASPPKPSKSTVVEVNCPPRAASTRGDRHPGGALGELIPCGGGAPIPLMKPRLTVGRSPACDVAIPSPTVSSKHCELRLQEGWWHVRDLGSRNGIRVDGIWQTSKYLRPGETLWIARLRFEVVYTPSSDEPPPEEDPFAMSLLEKAGLAGRGAAGRPMDLPREPVDPDRRKKWVIDDGNV
jgi:pSer/pThr/pTyr-binding forkhead associated (FHA) protein